MDAQEQRHCSGKDRKGLPVRTNLQSLALYSRDPVVRADRSPVYLEVLGRRGSERTPLWATEGAQGPPASAHHQLRMLDENHHYPARLGSQRKACRAIKSLWSGPLFLSDQLCHPPTAEELTTLRLPPSFPKWSYSQDFPGSPVLMAPPRAGGVGSAPH